MLYIIYSVTQSSNWQDIISLLIEALAIVADGLSIGLVILGMRLFSRLREKHEESVFGFYASFLVYLKLMKKAIGTQDSNVMLYNYVEDVRNKEGFNKKIPSAPELEQFKIITGETLQFLKTAEVQFSFSEDFYNERQELIEYLIEWQNLGQIFKYGNDDASKADDEFQKVTELLQKMIEQIETEQINMARPFWERGKRRRDKNKNTT